MTSPLRLGTRASRLALWQARYVADRLRGVMAGRPVELIHVETAGDRVRDVPLSQIGGDGLFTKAIQLALLDQRVDVAVHSLKDLPTEPVAGLTLAAVPPRGPSADVFISRKHRGFDELPPAARVATGSLRRRAFALARRPDLQLVAIRGNVETRLQKLTAEDLDGLILAQAGLERLGLADCVTEVLDPAWMLPAVGQGALGLECRADDRVTLECVRPLNDPLTHQAVLAERSLLRALGGGCLVPVGTASRVEGSTLHLRAVVARSDGSETVRGETSGPGDDPEGVGRRLAQDLLARGAGRLLAAR
jgi:hydroxymethylbilane synthase